MDRRNWSWLVGFGILVMLGLVALGGIWDENTATASYPSPQSSITDDVSLDNGYDALPPGLPAVLMSSLAQMDLAHPMATVYQPGAKLPTYHNPRSDIIWGPARNMSNAPGSLEPTAALHPTNYLLALSGGNASPAIINNTTDGGLTWHQGRDPHSGSGGDSGAVWLTTDPKSAIFMSLDCCTHSLNLSKTTDAGASWAAFSNVATPGFSYDRPYVWIDQDPTSPYYGRLYATTALFGASNYFTVGSQWSSDGGISWSPFIAWVDPYEYARMENADQFASLAAESNGTVVGAWLRGMCCHDVPEIVVPNKIMWTRSTDGGATFPISGTITTVPVDRSMSINSHSPAGFKWNAAPNIAADPIDGTLYAVWVAYRIPNQPSSAAVYFARGTPDGTSWTAPSLLYDNPDPGLFQYMPWLQVSRDHVVHASFGATVTNNNTLAEFYVQSTDRGNTFSVPFMVSEHTFTPATFMGDYQAASVGGYSTDHGALFVTWTENSGGTDQWGRIGTFPLSAGTATPTALTVTPSPTYPPSTSTSTPSGSTNTPTNTPCTISFTDVQPSDYFYEAVRYLYCAGVVSGYPDNTFRPYNNTTRAQLSKIAVLAEGWPINTEGGPHFSDVPKTHTFYEYIETAFNRDIISGYGDGTFRPDNNVTRAQLCKIIVLAQQWEIDTSGGPHFTDVPPSHLFYGYIETAYHHGIISGYANGTFRPNNNATRGQICKIVYQAITGP
jgi:hypothetical protein